MKPADNGVYCIADVNFSRSALAPSCGILLPPCGQAHFAHRAEPQGTWKLTFGAPLGARGLTPAMAALPSTDIDPKTKQDL